MTNEAVDLNQFIITLLEAAYRSIKQATDDLTDEQLYYQPTPESNSIAWLVWHLSRWRDAVSATISGESQIWVQEGWDQRCGIPGERTGMGDTPAQVTAFRVERAVLFGYVEAAHQRTVERVSQLTPTQLGQSIVSHTGEGVRHGAPWPACAAIRHNIPGRSPTSEAWSVDTAGVGKPGSATSVE